MKVHYPKLYNMAHRSLNVLTASKGSNNYILFAITAAGVCHGAICSVHHFETNAQVEWYATFLLLTSIVFMYI